MTYSPGKQTLITFLTLRSIVKVVPASSVSLESSVIGENLCLFSSQFPSLLFFSRGAPWVPHARLAAGHQTRRTNCFNCLVCWTPIVLFNNEISRFEVFFGCKSYRGDTKQNLKGVDHFLRLFYVYLPELRVFICGVWVLGCSKLCRFLNWGLWSAITISSLRY